MHFVLPGVAKKKKHEIERKDALTAFTIDGYTVTCNVCGREIDIKVTIRNGAVYATWTCIPCKRMIEQKIGIVGPQRGEEYRLEFPWEGTKELYRKTPWEEWRKGEKKKKERERREARRETRKETKRLYAKR